MVNEDIVRYEPSLSESTIFWTYNGIHIWLKLGSDNLENNFVENIAQPYWSQILHSLNTFDLGNQGDHNMINSFQHTTLCKEASNDCTHIIANDIPVSIEKVSCEAILTRCLG